MGRYMGALGVSQMGLGEGNMGGPGWAGREYMAPDKAGI